jgi:hypothetical protein
MSTQFTKCVHLLTVVVAIVLPHSLAYAVWESKHCCNPAHRDPAPLPPGAATACTWNAMNMKCENSGAYCTGEAWETAVPGKCCTPLIDGNTCNTNNGVTNVTIYKFYHKCTGATAAECKCGVEIATKIVDGIPEPVTDVKEVTQCRGSTCPAVPLCP